MLLAGGFIKKKGSKNVMNWIIGIIIGFFLDLLLGDPYWMPHPIRWIGSYIGWLDKSLRTKTERKKQRAMGIVLVILVLIPVAGITAGILLLCKDGWMLTGIIAIMSYQILAARCLQVESMKVCNALENGEVEKARAAVSMIVGRDTSVLDQTGITKAAVETVAENTSDGVIAPLFYLLIGGPVLGFVYKAINTMDSMVGYKNKTYMQFGWAAAKLDDIVNWIPARLSAILMIISAYLLQMNGRNAWKIWRRDRRKHASPNSAQTESVCAGALGVALAGDAVYFGKRVKKPIIGDAIREIEANDIWRANQLMYSCEVLLLILGVGIRFILWK